jgi:ketosteroid isomerase-like protein
VKNFKLTLAVVFAATMVATLAVESFAYPPFVGKARKFGAKDCTFCHVDPEGGAPWNERGQWLIKEKEKRGADAVNVDWLAEYKPGKAEDKMPPVGPAKPNEKNLPPQSASTPAGAVEQELLKLERAWLDAYVKRDVAAMEQIESDDFTITYPNGQVITKAQEIANLKRAAGAADSSTSFSTEGTKARVYGDTAILTGIVISSSKNSTERSRYTDVYVKRNGRWQVVASHLTRLAPHPTASPSAPAAPSGPTPPAASSASAFKVDPATFDAYVGQYDTPFGVLSITKEGNKLFGQPGGNSKEELLPESTDQFNVPAVEAKIKFVKDANGQVTHLLLNLMGQEINAKKIK